jgi:Cyclic nucleotide-binding domain
VKPDASDLLLNGVFERSPSSPIGELCSESHDFARLLALWWFYESKRKIKSKIKSKGKTAFDVQAFLDSAGVARKVVEYRRRQTIFSQGDPATTVIYIQEGGVKLSVVNEVGKEAVVAILGPGDFFGEGCLAGQAVCMGTATAIAPTTTLVVERNEMIRSPFVQTCFQIELISGYLLWYGTWGSSAHGARLLCWAARNVICRTEVEAFD